MEHYLTRNVLAPTPQSEPLPGRETEMEKNNAGGYTFKVDAFHQLQRWLNLGSEGGTYYAEERRHTLENAACLNHCIKEDPTRTLDMIMTNTRRAPKNDQCIFALAVMASSANEDARQMALSDDAIRAVLRTGTHLFMFAEFVDKMRGWGPTLMRAIGNWYLKRNPTGLSYQMTKYRNRNGWTHADLLRKAHPHPEGYPDHDMLFEWATQGKMPEAGRLPVVEAFERAKTVDPSELPAMIQNHRMTWEMLPTTVLKDPAIWNTLLPDMPPHALLRNLGRMTAIGAIGPYPSNEGTAEVLRKLANDETLQDERLHPLHVLIALFQYQEGKGDRGNLEWLPSAHVIDALDNAYDRSFDFAPQTGKRFYVGVDVSGSMQSGYLMKLRKLTPMVGAACLSLAIARREPNCYVAGFSHRMERLNITPKTTAAQVVNTVNSLPFARTDCSLPMLDALQHKIPVDCFVIITDQETWHGQIHPMEALRRYRQEMGIDARLAVIGLTSTRFTIADPQDPGCLDIAGFDSNIPSVLNLFATGQL